MRLVVDIDKTVQVQSFHTLITPSTLCRTSLSGVSASDARVADAVLFLKESAYAAHKDQSLSEVSQRCVS